MPVLILVLNIGFFIDDFCIFLALKTVNYLAFRRKLCLAPDVPGVEINIHIDFTRIIE